MEILQSDFERIRLPSRTGGTDGLPTVLGIWTLGPLQAVGVDETTGKETVLYSFTGGTDGANPYAGEQKPSHGHCVRAAEVHVSADGRPQGRAWSSDHAGVRQVAAMFAEERPALLPLPLEPFVSGGGECRTRRPGEAQAKRRGRDQGYVWDSRHWWTKRLTLL